MPDKKAEWSDYAYDNESISKRLGIDKEEVAKLKEEAAQKSQEESAVNLDKNGLGVGLNIDTDHFKVEGIRAGIKIPGFGLSYDSEGGGQIDILNFIEIETVRIKCYYVQRFYLAGHFLFSDIQKIDSEECNDKEPEPEPEPPDPSLDDIGPEPEPPKDPKIPDFPETFQGFYTFNHYTFYHETKPDYEKKGKSKDITTVKRLNIHSDPYYDIWQTIFKRIGSYEVFNPTPSDPASGNTYVIERLYWCIFPHALREKGIIVYQDFNHYYLSVASENLIHNRLLIPLGWNTPYGPVQYSESGYRTNLGWVYSGTTQSVKHFRQDRILEHWDVSGENGRTIRWSKIGEIKFYNFLALVPEQNNNPPLIDINKKENDMAEDCCRIMRKLAKYQGLGDSVKPIKIKDNEIKERGGNEDIFPLEVPKRWFDRKAKSTDKTEIKNMRHLLLSIGIMLDRFEELWNPAGKDSAFPLKKPEKGLWKWLPGDGGDYSYPDPDFDPKKSKDDGKIGLKSLKIETYLDLFRYFLESQIRMEMLFPIAQIRDSKISKRLIYPKASGEIQINDLIQLQELLLLYLNKTLGDPTASVIVKDADPTKEGDQPLTIENFDLSDMLRKLIRFSVDINSDIDLTNNFGKRTLYQLLSAMQVLVKNYELTEALFEDSGMTESQEIVKVKLYADPYAGGWKAGEGFDPNRVKIENTEANIESNLEAFLQETEIDVKVSRRAPSETTDVRDLLSQIGRYAAETAAQGKIPNTPEAIQAAIDKARFELQTDSAITRADVRQAASAGRVRTKRNTKKKRR